MIVEDVESGSVTGRATAILASNGARFFVEAIRDNPDGPVTMLTEISRTAVDYEVVIGEVNDETSVRASRTIWHKTVCFGANDRHVAGGAAFREAAREQEAVAFAALELVEAAR